MTESRGIRRKPYGPKHHEQLAPEEITKHLILALTAIAIQPDDSGMTRNKMVAIARSALTKAKLDGAEPGEP